MQPSYIGATAETSAAIYQKERNLTAAAWGWESDAVANFREQEATLKKLVASSSADNLLTLDGERFALPNPVEWEQPAGGLWLTNTVVPFQACNGRHKYRCHDFITIFH